MLLILLVSQVNFLHTCLQAKFKCIKNVVSFAPAPASCAESSLLSTTNSISTKVHKIIFVSPSRQTVLDSSVEGPLSTLQALIETEIQAPIKTDTKAATTNQAPSEPCFQMYIRLCFKCMYVR